MANRMKHLVDNVTNWISICNNWLPKTAWKLKTKKKIETVCLQNVAFGLFYNYKTLHRNLIASNFFHLNVL